MTNVSNTETEKQVGRAFLTEIGPSDITIQRCEPKPLREQAKRLLAAIKSDRLTARYWTAQGLLIITSILWLVTSWLPKTSNIFDMDALKVCLYSITLSLFLAGLICGLTMGNKIKKYQSI